MQQIDDQTLAQIDGGLSLSCAVALAGTVFATASLVVAFGALTTLTGGVSTGALVMLGVNYGGYVTAAFGVALAC